MTSNRQGTEYLYATTIPVLLDGKRLAGAVAMEIYVRHGLTSHWFGRGHSLSIAAYAERHPLPASLSRLSDDLILKMLLDFSAEHPGILALYPCSPEAEAFVGRSMAALESHYVVLSPVVSDDPLAPLVKKVY